MVVFYNMYVLGGLGVFNSFMYALITERVLTCSIYMHGIGALVIWFCMHASVDGKHTVKCKC